MIQIVAGLAPALLLMLYIYYADHLQREPMRQLWRAFFFGVGSIAVSLMFSTLLEIFGLDHAGGGLWGVLNQAFWGAAIPEESAKLLMLWFVVRRNPYFDERMDGIVYAVCVGMGFAGLENVMYLDEAAGDWITVGIMRALMAVPCHYYNAVAMGYFFSLYWLGKKEHRTRNLVLALLVPILMHGVYDTIAMALAVTDSFGLVCVLFVALIYVCTKCYKWARKKISQHIESDGRDIMKE